MDNQNGQYRRKPREIAETLTTISKESRVKRPQAPSPIQRIGEDIVSTTQECVADPKRIDGENSDLTVKKSIAFGIDQQPLRFNAFTVLNGQLIPQFVEPEIAVQVTTGFGARTNPAWLYAQYEVGFLIFANSFRRLVPEQYLGVGDWKFPAQFAQGELEFTVIRDNDCNTYGNN